MEIRVRTIPMSWSMITIPRLHDATVVMERRPMPWMPSRKLHRYPLFSSGMNNTSAWNATPNVHEPAMSAILPCVQNSNGCCDALPNIAMKMMNPVQLMRLAPVELQEYAPNFSCVASTCPRTVYRP